MKLFQMYVMFLLFMGNFQISLAQNIGIGTSSPISKLHIEGGISVRTPTVTTNLAPTPAQTYTMVNGITHSFTLSDSTGRIYDPGGAAGNYFPNHQCEVWIPLQNGSGSYIEFTIQSLSLGTGDSLFIYDGFDTDPVLFQNGNGFSGGNIVLNNFNNYGALVKFKTNGDASTGSGFNIFFKKVFVNNSITETPDQLSGAYFNYYPLNAALRSGQLSGAPIGKYSVALGDKCEASGIASFAAGLGAKANAYAAIALGSGCESYGYSFSAGLLSKATGLYSVALGTGGNASGSSAMSMGRLNNAIGQSSIAMGNGSNAEGNYSLAAGFLSKAAGNVSTALGTSLAKSYASLSIGQYNDTLASESETAWQPTDRVFVIGDGTSSSNRSSCFYILKNGNAWIQGNLTQASDARLKKNIQSLQNVLPRLVMLSGYNYYWKDEVNMPGLQAGFIAQELQQQIPELVTMNTEGQLAVNYSGMLPYFLEGLKEQQQIITSQQEQIEKLSLRLEKLEKLLNQQ